MKIIGRQREIESFDQIVASDSAEFIAVYGRRRVGKTYLIQQYFQNKGLYFELIGRYKAPQKLQLYNFAQTYADVFNGGVKNTIPLNWDEAFEQLKLKIDAQDASKKMIIFLDELPWLATQKSGFLEALDYFWNRYALKKPNVILIICGSAAAWMIKKIIANKAGLHNRLTHPPIRLMPFTLKETENYLQARQVCLERKQIIDVYMAIGGVAYYLNLIPRGKSTAEIINEMFFLPNASMQLEFHHLFSSLFQNSKKHIAIIKALAMTKQGLTQDELVKKVSMLSSGGGVSTLLDELEQCGFILKLTEFGKKKKERRYRLIDAYTLFFLKWIDGIGDVSETYWLRKMSSAAYFSWAEYAFENICFQHYREILEALKISVVAETKSSWSYKGSAEEQGAQIDLIIDRADKCINLCEIKYSDKEFVLDKEYAEVLRRKKSVFRDKTKTKKTVFTTMISPYGAKKNTLCLEVIDNQLDMTTFFYLT